jgi:hypothetical protein
MPKSKTTVQIRPDSSTPGVLGTHAELLARLGDLAPEPFDPRCVASPDELKARGEIIEKSFMVFQTHVLALLIDARQHNWAVHVEPKYLDALFIDLRREAAGTLYRAAETIEEVQEAA